MAMVWYGKNPKLLNLQIHGVQHLSFVHELRFLCCSKHERKLPGANKCFMLAHSSTLTTHCVLNIVTFYRFKKLKTIFHTNNNIITCVSAETSITGWQKNIHI